MTYISRKTRLFVPYFVDECDPRYFDYLMRKRSDGRLKRHSSCDDLRAWADDHNLNYQYLLDLMSNGEFQGRPFSGMFGRFIPIKALQDVIPKNADCGDNCRELGGGKRRAGPRSKMNLQDSSINEATDDLLRLADVAMTKLETIRCIVCPRICKDNRELNGRSGKDFGTVSKECTSVSDSGRYLTDYNNTLTKMASLQQKLYAIEKRRYDLNVKIKTSLQQTKCQSSSHVTVKELFKREDNTNMKLLQNLVKKLQDEKYEVLKEMCSSLKHLSQLKENFNEVDGAEKCSCLCTEIEEYKSGRMTLSPRQERFLNAIPNSLKKVSSKFSFQERKGGNQEMKVWKRKCTPSPTIDSLTLNRVNSPGSSEATVASWQDVPLCDSQKTFNVIVESVPVKKFKSETTMTEVEQALRSYEQRLCDVGYLETEIEQLKREADMAEYFKKKLIRSVLKGKMKKEEGKEMKREIEQLEKENCELKKMLQTLAREGEKERSELQYLRFKAAQISGYQEDMTKMKKQISDYKLSCVNQYKCIGRLENTIKEQRDEISRLTDNMARLYLKTDKLLDLKKFNKKNVPRSRSYDPHRSNNASENHKSYTRAPEEELKNTPYCCCSRNFVNTDPENRPRSECGKRPPEERRSGSLPRPQIYKNQSRHN